MSRSQLSLNRLLIKSVWKAARVSRLILVWLFYKVCEGIYFRQLGWGTKIYGRLRFGNAAADIRVGRDCMIGHEVFLSATDTSSVIIGSGCSINNGCHIVSTAKIEIGDETAIGEFVSIRDQNHTFSDPDKAVREQGFTSAAIKIGRDVWIGRGVFIGPGVEIGDRCVIGANSVVVKSIPAHSIAVGAPARVIGTRGVKKTETQG